MYLLVVFCNGSTVDASVGYFNMRFNNNTRLIGMARNSFGDSVRFKVCICENCKEEDIEDVTCELGPSRIRLVYGDRLNGMLIDKYRRYNGKMEYIKQIHGENADNAIYVRMCKPDAFDQALTKAKIRECLSLN